MKTLMKLADWFDDRTGIRHVLHEALYERIPGGAHWRYVWGSTLMFTFGIQMVTGLCLWAAYSPSSQTAWESVYYIQHEMSFGWLLRGIHHYTAQTMVVLLAIHVLQVVLYGAYRAPREVNWLLGVLLLLVTLGLSLTGYLLPWDEKGYWATKVATNIMAIAPGGGKLQALVVGGTEYGHHTLTRFFALHAGLLPATLIALLVAHIAVFRRHGVTYSPRDSGETTFWPEQVCRDTVACLGVLLVILWLVLRHGIGPEGGANLGAPADPSRSYDAARPEWYFLFLFQFLKYFPGTQEIIGAIIIPTVILLALAAFPWIGHYRIGHVFNIFILSGLLLGTAYLTWVALDEDENDPDYNLAVAEAEKNGKRAAELASILGVPEGGASRLMLEDPKTQGPYLFSENCKMCHRWQGHDGRGYTVYDEPTASDLYQLGKEPEKWIRGILEKPDDPQYLGNTAFADGAMVQFVKAHMNKASKGEIDALVALLLASAEGIAAEENFRDQDSPPEPASPQAALIRKGLDVFELGFENALEDSEAMSCLSCHAVGSLVSDGIEPGPDLTGYLAPDGKWLTRMILDPAHDQLYGSHNDRMPSFRKQLNDQQVSLLVRWMQQNWPKKDDLSNNP